MLLFRTGVANDCGLAGGYTIFHLFFWLEVQLYRNMSFIIRIKKQGFFRKALNIPDFDVSSQICVTSEGIILV